MTAPSRFQRLVALGVASTVAVRLLRPWYLNWGATEEEIARPMPLDDRILDPGIVTTRAITIKARLEQVWPWIVQMGEPPRAGFYSYTWIERLQGLNITNIEWILPEYQTLNVGDSLDKAGNMRVLGIEPGRYLALGPPVDCDWLWSTWVIAVYPLGAHSTRLVTRLRGRLSFRRMLKALPPTVWPFWFFIEPGVFVMERKMMLEIKRLAERSSRPDATAAAGRAFGEPVRMSAAAGESTNKRAVIDDPIGNGLHAAADAPAYHTSPLIETARSERGEDRTSPALTATRRTRPAGNGPL